MFSFKDYNIFLTYDNIFLTYDNSDPFFLEEICRILPNSTTQDCGSTDPPAVVMLGGWAKQNSVGVVAASSRTGHIFCHTRQINGTEAVLVTAEEVQEVAGRISSPRARYPQVNFRGFILIFWGYNYNIAIIFTIIYYNGVLIYYMLYIYIHIVLVGGFKHVIFSISYMGCHPSHWRTHIFQDCYWPVMVHNKWWMFDIYIYIYYCYNIIMILL